MGGTEIELGRGLREERLECLDEAGLKPYDRFLPNQDTLPRAGFVNLIALPSQKGAREKGNSVFVDERLVPFEDQWAFLASIEKISKAQVETLVRKAEGRGHVIGVRMSLPDDEDAAEPWKLTPSRRRDSLPVGEMPARIEMVLADSLYVPKAALPPSLRNALIRIAAFQNPEFYKAQAMRLPVYDKPRIISCAEDHAEHLALPRGCLEEVLDLLRALKIKTTLRDERFSGKRLELVICCTLRPEQEKVGVAMMSHDFGILAATTAFGKTVLAAWSVA